MDKALIIFIYILVFLSRFAKPLSKIGLGSYSQWKPGEKLELLLVGYNGARNTGADARVTAIASQIHTQYSQYRERLSAMGRFLKTYITTNLS